MDHEPPGCWASTIHASGEWMEQRQLVSTTFCTRGLVLRGSLCSYALDGEIPAPYVSYNNLKTLKGNYMGVIKGVIKGDTWGLDFRSYTEVLGRNLVPQDTRVTHGYSATLGMYLTRCHSPLNPTPYTLKSKTNRNVIGPEGKSAQNSSQNSRYAPYTISCTTWSAHLHPTMTCHGFFALKIRACVKSM